MLPCLVSEAATTHTQANTTAFKQSVRKKVMTRTRSPFINCAVTIPLDCVELSGQKLEFGVIRVCTPVPDVSAESGLFPHFISKIFRVSANSPA